MAIDLSPSQTTLLTQVIASLDSERFCADLLALVDALVHFDSAVMMAYPDDATLMVLHDALDSGDRAGFDGPYRNGLYVLSPLYVESHAGRRGFFHIDDIAPNGFTDSEFYELYYGANNNIDQVAWLLETGAGTALALSLERTRALPPFDCEERKKLDAFTPLLSTLVKTQHWPSLGHGDTSPPIDMHAHLQGVLLRFGSSVLTPRERQVVGLILRGYPSKSVAKELHISTQTEQVHRKNIYQKLAISSHTELFSLFFDAVSLPGSFEGDPITVLQN